MAEEEHGKPPEGGKEKGKKGGTLSKYKWYFVGGGVLLIVIYIAVKRSNANSNSSTSAQPSNVDPATGYSAGSPADLAALGYSTNSSSGSESTTPGPAGPAGPAGPTGATGKTGATGATGSAGTTVNGGKPPSGGHPPVQASTFYTVASGNTLWGIAQKFYGNGAKWQTIYSANRGIIGSNPNLIHPGQRLVIPGK